MDTTEIRDRIMENTGIERWPEDIEQEMIDELWEEQDEFLYRGLPEHVIEMIKLNYLYGESNE